MAARAGQLGRWYRGQFGDLHPERIRTAFDVLPPEGVGELSLELIAQRDRVMVVEQNEVVAWRKLKPRL